jgi:cytochrome c553
MQMKAPPWTLSLAALALALTGCADPSRSRNLADPRVPAQALAQQVCSNCHGVTGVSVSPNFPNLAAQPEPYLLAQLQEFKSHNREDPAGFEYMWGISRSLSDAQMQGLAAYFASQPAPPPQSPPRHGDVAHGAEIFRAGLPDQSIPACGGCHGNAGQGNATFPRLAGQHTDYVIKQLTVFQRTNERPSGAVMKTVAHDLTGQNMLDVAAYVQTLSGQ